MAQAARLITGTHHTSAAQRKQKDRLGQTN